MKQKSYKIVADKRKLTHNEWLLMRNLSIGGSEIATAIGASRWSTPFQLWTQKTGRSEKSKSNQEAMYWGTVMEPILREEFSKRTGYQVKEVDYIFSSIKYDFLTANIDGCILLPNDEYAILEIKTASSHSESDWLDGVPIEYYIQTQYYLYITGLNKAFIAVLIGGNNFKYIELDRDETTIDVIVKLAVKFWETYIIHDVPPPVKDLDNDILNKIYPKSNPITVNMPSEFLSVLEQYNAAKLLLEKGKTNKEEAEAKIKAFLQDAEVGLIGEYKICYKTISRKILSTEKVKSFLNEEQLSKCTIASESRTLRISKLKEKI
mgnify:FL=1